MAKFDTKQEISPAVAAIVIILVLAIAVLTGLYFTVWRQTVPGASPIGETFNPSPGVTPVAPTVQGEPAQAEPNPAAPEAQSRPPAQAPDAPGGKEPR